MQHKTFFTSVMVLAAVSTAGLVAHAAAGAGSEKPSGAAQANGKHARRSMLDRADANKDGKVTLAEAEAEAPRLAVIFAAVDSNRDGAITAAEESGFHDKMKAAGQAAKAKRFAKLDANRDGAITANELPQRGNAERDSKRFARLDVNADGKVTQDEFAAMRGRGHGKHGRGGKHERGGHERGGHERGGHERGGRDGRVSPSR